jgi:hypothetical protein
MIFWRWCRGRISVCGRLSAGQRPSQAVDLPLRRRTLFLEQRKKPGSKPGFPVLLTAGGVIISTLIDPRSIIVVAGVGSAK